LKESFPHRDVMRLIRETIKVNNPNIAPKDREISMLKKYEEWVIDLAKAYPTTLAEDRELLAKVQTPGSNYHWMY